MKKLIGFIFVFSVVLQTSNVSGIASEKKGGDGMNAQRWVSQELKYEGFPLMLRRPTNINYDLLQARYPRLLAITHQLAKVRSDGMPEPKYNSGLGELDHEIINHFARSNNGQTVLVETFGGKRNYYIYLSDRPEVEKEVAEIAAMFPGEKITFEVSKDPAWKFIRGYAKDYWEGGKK